MQAAKIIIGALLLIGGLGNIPGAMEMPNPRQAAGYMIPTIFFIFFGWMAALLWHQKKTGRRKDLRSIRN